MAGRWSTRWQVSLLVLSGSGADIASDLPAAAVLLIAELVGTDRGERIGGRVAGFSGRHHELEPVAGGVLTITLSSFSTTAAPASGFARISTPLAVGYAQSAASVRVLCATFSISSSLKLGIAGLQTTPFISGSEVAVASAA